MNLGRVRLAGSSLGQVDQAAAVRDAKAAVERYDGLLSDIALLDDDGARGEIVKWLGRADIPGSPAERYSVVADALVTGVEPDDLYVKRVSDLKGINEELNARVETAQPSGSLPAPESMGAGSASEEGTAMGKCLAGGIALLGLFVLPFIVD